MDNLTRRRFLGWTSAGAAGLGLLAFVPRLASRDGAPSALPLAAQPPEPALSAVSDPVVAYVHNPASGNLSLMIGTREIAVHDPDLVARLMHGAAGGR